MDPSQRFSPQQLVEDMHKQGQTAHYMEDVEMIISHLANNLGKDDVVVIMSTGAFGGIYQKLPEALKTR